MGISIVGKNVEGKVPTWRGFIADTEDDIATLPTTVAFGSECYCSENGKIYILETDGDWVEKESSGGGSALPEVTSDDNGDVLTVVEGEWAKASLPVVEVGNNIVLSNDSVTELSAAIQTLVPTVILNGYAQYGDAWASVSEDECEAIRNAVSLATEKGIMSNFSMSGQLTAIQSCYEGYIDEGSGNEPISVVISIMPITAVDVQGVNYYFRFTVQTTVKNEETWGRFLIIGETIYKPQLNG